MSEISNIFITIPSGVGEINIIDFNDFGHDFFNIIPTVWDIHMKPKLSFNCYRFGNLDFVGVDTCFHRSDRIQRSLIQVKPFSPLIFAGIRLARVNLFGYGIGYSPTLTNLNLHVHRLNDGIQEVKRFLKKLFYFVDQSLNNANE